MFLNLFLNLTGKDLLPYSKSVEISSQKMFNVSLFNLKEKESFREGIELELIP